MIFQGSLLWSATSGSPASWTTGSWKIDASGITMIDEAGTTGSDFTGFAVPGFVDSHAHIGVGSDGPVGLEEQEVQACAQRNTGVLALRDCGAPVDNRWLDSRDDLPKLIRAGRHIARPKRYIRGMPIDCENLADLPDLVAEQAKRGDGWVKLVGDWIDRSNGADSDLDPLWPTEVLIDAVAAAHENGAKVAVHSFAHATIDSLLEAGVDDIEHATGMDADQADEAARRGVLVTPTLLQVELFKDFADQAGAKYPVYAATMSRMYDERREHFAMLREFGVTLVMGSDSGGYQEHGTIGKEFELWLDRGVSRLELIDVATWKSRIALNFEQLSPGASADLLIYREDPRTSGALDQPDQVVINGQLVYSRS